MLALFPTPKRPRQKRKPKRRRCGRPPSDRLRHLRVLALAELYHFNRDAIAVQERISRRTVFRWIAIAKTYPEAENHETLRQAIAG